MPEKTADETITMTRGQLQRLLGRFAAEVEARGGQMQEAEIESVADRLLDDLSPKCRVTGSHRMLNSNVSVRIG